MPYQIQDGDSYAKIAREIYGDERMAGELMRVNASQPLYAGNVINLAPKVDNPYISYDQFAEMKSFGKGEEQTQKGSVAVASATTPDATFYGTAPEDLARARNQGMQTQAAPQAETQRLQSMANAYQQSAGTQQNTALVAPKIVGGKTTADLQKQAEYLKQENALKLRQHLQRTGTSTFGNVVSNKAGMVNQTMQMDAQRSQTANLTQSVAGPAYGTANQNFTVGGRGSGVEFELVTRANDFSTRAKKAAEHGDKSFLPKIITDDSFVELMFAGRGDYEAYLQSIGYKKIGTRKWVLTGATATTTTSTGGSRGYSSRGGYYYGGGGGGGGYYSSSTGRGFSLGPINWRIG